MTFAGERSTASRRAAGIVVLSVALTLGLTSCSADPPGPDEASKKLAAALSSGKFSSAPLTAADAPAAAAQWPAAYEGLKPCKPTVELASTAIDAKDEDSATATLRFTWDVDDSDTDWTYDTHARLTRADDDTWQAAWSPTLLAPDLNPTEKLVVKRTVAPRANVLGAGGAVIIEPRAVNRLGVDKTHVTDAAGQAAAARALATALG